jgi:hypothetical protein
VSNIEQIPPDDRHSVYALHGEWPPRKNDGSARRLQRAEAVHFALRMLVATHTEGTEVMRGLGKIERAILDDITIGGPSSVLIHSWGLLCHHMLSTTG